jgi:glycosyltransferase involved in cell wall biosynthesis
LPKVGLRRPSYGGSEQPMIEPAFSIVCVSSQPWAAELPTNRQQIMLRAAGRNHRVLFVETNDFVGRHVARALKGAGSAALRRMFTADRAFAGVLVRKAVNVLPWGQKYKVANRVNAAVTARFLRRDVARLPKPVVLWIYDPGFSHLIGSVGEDLAVYDCVDAYEEQAGSDRRRRRLIAAGDARAASRAGLVFATTHALLNRQLKRNERTHLVRNVGDYEHFRAASERTHPSGVAQLSQPVLGFAGNFLPSKVDFGLVEEIADARPDWTLLLIGPSPTEARDRLEALAARTNVHWLGLKRYEDLPHYVAAFDVALIPYLENEYTRSCFPLKLYEYLAAGKPVVASGLPELEGMEPDVVVTRGVQAFVRAVESAMSLRGRADVERRMAIAARNTWETRTARLLELVAVELARA